MRSSRETHHGVDPTTGVPLWASPIATQRDLDDAVEAAKRALEDWSSRDHSERSRFLKLFADKMEVHAEELTNILSKESGKPVSSFHEAHDAILTKFLV